jgi:hypothetical protein
MQWEILSYSWSQIARITRESRLPQDHCIIKICTFCNHGMTEVTHTMSVPFFWNTMQCRLADGIQPMPHYISEQ